MPDNRRRNTLQLLANELSFLRLGGYGRPFRSHWRPTLIFRDSPTCLNFDSGAPIQPCERCPLFQFIPEAKHNCRVPCHSIPLNERAETIASMYETGTQQQLDNAVRRWLEATIKKLEREEKSNAGS